MNVTVNRGFLLSSGGVMEIKAIETSYKGYRFRSRLEARWAVFYDALGIEWRYEMEGYELPAGRYLPDFFLPEYPCWVEIKGIEPSHHELTLANELRRGTNQTVLVVSGNIGSPACDTQGIPYDFYEKPEYDIRVFPGHFDESLWPYTHETCLWFGSIHRWQSLRRMLRCHGIRSRPFDGTWASVDALIELDRAYYLGRYGKKHPRWDHGPNEGDCQWTVANDRKLGLGMVNVLYQQAIYTACNVARSARFEYGKNGT